MIIGAALLTRRRFGQHARSLCGMRPALVRDGPPPELGTLIKVLAIGWLSYKLTTYLAAYGAPLMHKHPH